MRFKVIGLTAILILASWNVADAANIRRRVVREVKIEGLKMIDEATLFREISLSTKQGYVLKDTSLEEDVKTLFLSGYFSEVSQEVKQKGRGLTIIFRVKERPLVNDIVFIGNTRFQTRHLIPLLKTRPKRILNMDFLQQDIKRLKSHYHGEGYELFDVQSVDLNPSSNLQFKVVEGTINRVRLKGLKKIKPFVVHREISQKSGEVFNSTTLRRDRVRLLKLGYFSEVSLPKLTPIKGKNEVDIAYAFRERKINLFDLGIEQLRDDTGVAGFFRIHYNHLLMYSDVFSLKTQLLLDGDLSVRSYSFRYLQPWAFNMLPITMAFDLWTEFRREPFSGESDVHSNIREGVDFILGVPIIRDELTISAKAKYETVSPRDGEDFEAYSSRSLSTIISWDTRDNIANPDRGHYGILTVERGGDLGFYDFGGLDFTRWSINVAKFFRISEKGIIALHANYGVFDRDSDQSVKTFESEEFPLGGVSSLRGYNELDFRGPKRVLLNVEYRHSLTRDIQGALFYDIGRIFDEDVSLNFANYEVGLGFGFRFITGLAPFRIDFGFGRDFMIHFGIGQTF